MNAPTKELVTVAELGDTGGLDKAIGQIHQGLASSSDAEWLQMMDARVAFSEYFQHVRDGFSVLEGHAPIESAAQTPLEFTNFGDLAESLAEEVEEGFEKTAGYAEIPAQERSFTDTKLHLSLQEGNSVAQGVMRLIISGDYYGLDTAGGVVNASRSQVLALLKNIHEMSDIAREQQNQDGAINTTEDESGQVIRNAFESGHSILNHAIDGLLPPREESEVNNDN